MVALSTNSPSLSEMLSGNLTWTVMPVAGLLAAWPHWYTIYLAESNKVQGGWSNVNPRSWVIQLNAKAAAGRKLSPVEQTILRGQACQSNSFENIPLFLATVIFANYAKLPKTTINNFIITYYVTRFLYTLLYLKTQSYSKSFIRTVVFNTAILHMVYIWMTGGKNLL